MKMFRDFLVGCFKMPIKLALMFPCLIIDDLAEVGRGKEDGYYDDKGLTHRLMKW